MKKAKITALIAICIFALLLSGCGKKEEPAPAPEPVPTEAPALEESVPAQEAVEPGTLIESGSGLNENYYDDVSYYGLASNLTDSSFQIAKEAMGYGPGAVPLMAPLTITYDESTLVRSSVLHANSDKYEVYAATQADMAGAVSNIEYMFDIVVADPDASQPHAVEIRISKMLFD